MDIQALLQRFQAARQPAPQSPQGSPLGGAGLGQALERLKAWQAAQGQQGAAPAMPQGMQGLMPPGTQPPQMTNLEGMRDLMPLGGIRDFMPLGGGRLPQGTPDPRMMPNPELPQDGGPLPFMPGQGGQGVNPNLWQDVARAQANQGPQQAPQGPQSLGSPGGLMGALARAGDPAQGGMSPAQIHEARKQEAVARMMANQQRAQQHMPPPSAAYHQAQRAQMAQNFGDRRAAAEAQRQALLERFQRPVPSTMPAQRPPAPPPRDMVERLRGGMFR